MQFGNLFSFSYWLDPAVLERPAGPLVWLLVALGALWALGAIVLWRARQASRDVMLAQAIGGALVAAVAIGRLCSIPVLGLRAGWLLAALIAGAPIALRVTAQARRDGLFDLCLRAVTFTAGPRNAQSSWRLTMMLAWAGLHLFGLMAVCAVARLPLALAPALFALLLTPAALSALRRMQGKSAPAPARQIITQGLAALTPLLLVYGALALRVLIGFVARVVTGEFRVIEPFGALLNLPLALIVMSAYALLASIYRALQYPIPNTRYAIRNAQFVNWGALTLMAGVVVWAGWTALTLRTHGVSGSDPYAYAQMGVDLAERGTVFHHFPLARLTYALGIPTEPIVHVGYKLPQDVSRMATTVWPPGYAVFTGAAYTIAGEQGLYLITPLLSLISLLAIAWMARAFTHPPGPLRGRGSRMAVAALAVFMTATSYQQVEWQMIPMADVAAQLFSVLALVLAYGSQLGQSPRLPASILPLAGQPGPASCARSAFARAALSGVCLGVAFDIRYTQVLIAPALALALLMPISGAQPAGASGQSRWRSIVARLPCVAVCAGFALLAALPALIYHTLAFGSPLHTGSEEWANFSLTRLPETAWRTVNEMLAYREFGLLSPFVVLGAGALWRGSRRGLWALLAYFAPLFIFHAAYWPLRLRDILSLFPVFSILAAIGVVWLVQRLIEANHQAPARWKMAGLAGLLVCLSFAAVLRSMDTLALPVTRGFSAFGYLVREQRASFTQIGRLTPPNAVIGCSLNSGPVDLYAGRLTFRPANWTPDQMTTFVRALRAEGAPVYLLDDGAEMAGAIQALRAQFTLREIARLDVPYYFAGSGSENRKAALYAVAD